MRPIDADTLIKELEELREAYRNDHDDDGYYATEDFGCLVRNAPTLDVRPVVHGHWKNWKDEHTCSACRGVVIKVWGDDEYDYCPYCGNPMDEKEEL